MNLDRSISFSRRRGRPRCAASLPQSPSFLVGQELSRRLSNELHVRSSPKRIDYRLISEETVPLNPLTTDSLLLLQGGVVTKSVCTYCHSLTGNVDRQEHFSSHLLASLARTHSISGGQ
ncbi:Gypsy retrotransposon integrase-like protein [Schistosoma japonicum]|uniref:Gypsy retrotransposon integrase-like protein n=1 Tax=Schistosoma japonicum TaxID=6182 RepID=A0A4Z2D7L0_SCHJA|nr:Gypsy retrotransposon integrase-like protein [Schistosoma japonicum]